MRALSCGRLALLNDKKMRFAPQNNHRVLLVKIQATGALEPTLDGTCVTRKQDGSCAEAHDSAEFFHDCGVQASVLFGCADLYAKGQITGHCGDGGFVDGQSARIPRLDLDGFVLVADVGLGLCHRLWIQIAAVDLCVARMQSAFDQGGPSATHRVEKDVVGLGLGQQYHGRSRRGAE